MATVYSHPYATPKLQTGNVIDIDQIYVRHGNMDLGGRVKADAYCTSGTSTPLCDGMQRIMGADSANRVRSVSCELPMSEAGVRIVVREETIAGASRSAYPWIHHSMDGLSSSIIADTTEKNVD